MAEKHFKFTRKQGKRWYDITLAYSEDYIGTIRYDGYRDEWTFYNSFAVTIAELKEIVDFMEWLQL